MLPRNADLHPKNEEVPTCYDYSDEYCRKANPGLIEFAKMTERNHEFLNARKGISDAFTNDRSTNLSMTKNRLIPLKKILERQR